jgi:hypothetical protein
MLVGGEHEPFTLTKPEVTWETTPADADVDQRLTIVDCLVDTVTAIVVINENKTRSEDE